MDNPKAPRTKSRYAAQLLPLATRIVESVHDGSHQELLGLIGRARALDTRPDDIDPDVALMTILAAMVNPASSLDTMLGWVRTITPVQITATPDGDYEVQLSIEGALPAAALTTAQRRQVVATLHHRGLNTVQISDRTGLQPRVIERDRHTLGLTKPRPQATEEAA
jgi:hypothetical protein